jgi:hypothetical protein
MSEPQLIRVLGQYELRHYKLWFDEKCLGFLDQRKQATVQWLQDPNQSNVDNLNNVRHKASRYFMGGMDWIDLA